MKRSGRDSCERPFLQGSVTVCGKSGQPQIRAKRLKKKTGVWYNGCLLYTSDLAVQIVGELVTKEAMTEYYKMHQGIPAVNGVDVKLTSIPADVSALIEAGKTSTLPNTIYSTPSMALSLIHI